MDEARNPYAPPAARVSDPAVEPVPRIVRWSVWINVAVLISNPIIGAFDGTLMPEVSAESRSAYQAGIVWGFVMGGMVDALFAVLLYKIYCRRNWARMVFALFTTLGLIAYTPHVLNQLPVHPIVGTLNVLYCIASVAAVVMLFAPAANRWISR